MGRREKPLGDSSPAVLDIASGLRELRVAAGSPPYSALARRCGYSTSALSQAASGSSLPSLDTTLAYVQACGGDIAVWRERWHTAAAQLAGVAGDADPTAAVDVPSFAAELTKLVHQAGFHNLRTAVAASNKEPTMSLSRTTLGRALRGEVLPTEAVLLRVLLLCPVSAQQQAAWIDTRSQISRSRLTSNVVRFQPIVEPRPSNPDPAIALGYELRRLARGRGLESAILQTGQAVHQLCNVAPDAPPHIVRAALIACLMPALRELPEDLQLVAAAGLALATPVRGRQFLNERLRWCAEQLDRDDRTIRRRFDEATYLLAQRLLASQTRPLQAPPDVRRNQG